MNRMTFSLTDFQGDLVQLKLLPENGSNFELKNKSVEYLVMVSYNICLQMYDVSN